MKIPTTFIKTNGPKLAWLICGLFLVWILYGQYRIIDEAVLHPPLVQENQVTARQSKINQKLIDIVKNNHALKKSSETIVSPTQDPFAPASDDTGFRVE